MDPSKILFIIAQELGKLTLRAEEKQLSPIAGAKEFVSSHRQFFHDSEKFIQQLEEFSEDPLQLRLQELFGSSEEPCYAPLSIADFGGEKAPPYGFLIHIFKGEQDIAPSPVEQITIGPRQYRKLLHNFNHDLKRLESPLDIANWLYLFKRYGKWIVSTAHSPTVSLYNYTWLKTALASCLEEDVQQQDLLLVAGRFTGVSDFVAGLDLQKNLTPLKGQLYSLQLLRELVVEGLLHTAGLPLCNCLSQTAESFYLLARTRDEEPLREYLSSQNVFLQGQFAGALGVACCYKVCSVADLLQKDGGFPAYYAQLQDDLQRQSTQNLAGLAANEYQNIFAPSLENGKNTSGLTELGESLIKTRWIIVEEPSSPKADHWSKIFAEYGFDFRFVPRKPDGCGKILRFGNTDFSCPEGIGFKFSENIPFLPADQPVAEKTPNILFSLCLYQNKQHQDDIFQWMAHRELLQDFFFTYMAALLREKKYRKFTYLANLCGNRMLIIGSPGIMLGLVSQIYTKLREFIPNRYSLYGCIDAYPKEFPISRAVYEHEQALKTTPLREKLCICGNELPWPVLGKLLQLQEKLISLSKIKGKRNISSLWGIAEFSRLAPPDSQVIPWNHLITYYFERLNIGDGLDKKFLQEQTGGVCLSLAMRWNHWISMQE